MSVDGKVHMSQDVASWWGGFWERFVSMIKSCLKMSIGSKKLLFTEVFEVENVLNNHSL